MSPEVALYTTSEIAARYSVDTSTVRRWVGRGLLKPALTTPGGHHRFNLVDVERILSVAA